MQNRREALMFCWSRDFSYLQTNELLRKFGFNEVSRDQWDQYGEEAYAAMIEFFRKEQNND